MAMKCTATAVLSRPRAASLRHYALSCPRARKFKRHHAGPHSAPGSLAASKVASQKQARFVSRSAVSTTSWPRSWGVTSCCRGQPPLAKSHPVLTESAAHTQLYACALSVGRQNMQQIQGSAYAQALLHILQPAPTLATLPSKSCPNQVLALCTNQTAACPTTTPRHPLAACCLALAADTSWY